MAEYYFLASLLPPLEIGHVPSLGFKELKELLRVNLTKEDKEKVTAFLRLIDLENLRRLWTGEPLDKRGNLTQEELEIVSNEKQWPEETPFGSVFHDFLEKYKTTEERIRAFSFLMGKFLDEQSGAFDGFLGSFFEFERAMRLVFLGFRAKKLDKNVVHELQYEDASDTLVAQIIAQKDAKGYEPPFEFKELKPLFDQYEDNPLELHKALVAFRFNEMLEMASGAHFSIERILGYMARLLLVEKWLELNVQEGISVIDKIEGYVK